MQMQMVISNRSFHYGLTNDEYASLQGVRFSLLRWMDVSPKHYAWWAAHKAPDTPQFALGRAVHLAVLEPDTFYATRPTPQRSSEQGISTEDYELAARVRESVLAVPDVQHLLTGRHEVVVQWDILDIHCKAKQDVLSFDGQRVVELKTTKSMATATESIWRYHYDAQLAWYCDAAGAREAVIVFAETQPPYDVAICQCPAWLMERGRAKYHRWLMQLRVCLDIDAYPGVGRLELEHHLESGHHAI